MLFYLIDEPLLIVILALIGLNMVTLYEYVNVSSKLNKALLRAKERIARLEANQ